MDRQKLIAAAKAAGYEIKRPGTVICFGKGRVPYLSPLDNWCPLSPEKNQNLQADARIEISWCSSKKYVMATAWEHDPENGDDNFEAEVTLSEYPTPADAMRVAVVLCAVAKGEAMLKSTEGGSNEV